MYIPPGFNTVTPYFSVRDADRFVAFLVDGLGGIEVLRNRRPDGRVGNVQVRIGTSTIMAGEVSADGVATPASYYLYVENADASMAQAMTAGATQVMAVADMPYGDRQGGVRDCEGNIWWISQRLVEAPY